MSVESVSLARFADQLAASLRAALHESGADGGSLTLRYDACDSEQAAALDTVAALLNRMPGVNGIVRRTGPADYVLTVASR